MTQMEIIFKKVINDKDIFPVKKEIFNEKEWETLKEIFKNDKNDFIKEIKKRILEIKISALEGNREYSKKAIKLLRNLINSTKKRPFLLEKKLDKLNSFGVIKSNLPPSMDNYGEVIEKYNIVTIKQYFFDKIKKEKNIRKKKALTKLLNYVLEMDYYNYSPEHIAHFVKTLNSLTLFWEI